MDGFTIASTALCIASYADALKNSISWFTVHTFTPNFVYSFQINWKMLHISLY